MIMTRPDFTVQIKTVVSSFVMALVGASLVVLVGLMARPGFSDIPAGVAAQAVSAGVVNGKAVPSRMAGRDEFAVR